MKVPKRLAHGDRVAVVAPSGRVHAERLEIGIEHLRRWGLEVEVMPSVLAGHDRLDYLAADDKARAEDLRSAWLDEQFAAVLCARGGYGVQRMLEYVDFDELAAVPKWFVGFSDITALHEPLNARGLVTIHGPMAAAVEQLGAEVGRQRRPTRGRRVSSYWRTSASTGTGWTGCSRSCCGPGGSTRSQAW